MKSVLEIIYKQVKNNPNGEALHYLENEQYKPITFLELALNSQRLNEFILENCDDGANVIIWSNNCWQWAVTDLACQLAGVVSVPIYPTAGLDQLSYIFNDSKPVIVFVDYLTKERLDSLSSIDSIKKIIPYFSFEDRGSNSDVIMFDDLLSFLPHQDQLNDSDWIKDRLDQNFTVLYTSGTTGIPKAVPLTHNNIVQNFLGILDIIPITKNDTSLSFLPLSHIFERTVGFFCVLGVGAKIYYAESIDTVARDLLVAKPTFIISVPRLYEKIYQKVVSNAKGAKKVILNLALAIGRTFKRRSFLWNIAYKVVFSKIHQKTGGNVRFLVTGGAPIPAHIEVFFNSIGLPVVQGYGLSETSPIVTGNLDEKVGSVGKPLDNLDVKIADDGEVLVKGPSVFSGYSNVSNDDVFTEDGYFKTGDFGSLDSENYLYITGRKKEIIILSNGKNVVPNQVEEKLVQSEFVNQVMVVGDNRNFLVALVVPDVDQVRHALDISDDLDKISIRNDVKTLIQRDLNLHSETLARYESVKNIALIPNEFSIEGKELTPTLKLRRNEISKKYQNIINLLYENVGEKN